MAEDASRSVSLEQVHAAWLAAGADGDVRTMAELRREHPAWLDLQRPVGPALTDVNGTTSVPTRFCGWEGFHLPTIGASALHTAAWEGKLPVMELLLEAGQSPDTADDGGMTPIMVAILRYNLVATRCVFRHGQAISRNVVVDCRETEKRLEKTTLDIIELLLRFGASVNASSQEHKTVLHCAAHSDALQVAKRLIDAGADIDAPDKKGRSPLFCCVEEDSLLVANLLLSRGANIDLADISGLTPLTFALQKQSLSLVQLFLNHHHMVAVPHRHDFGAAVLLQAVELGSESVARLIVEDEDTSITVRNAAGETPLHRAIILKKPTLVGLLLHLDPTGESLQATTREGKSPAHYAAQYGSREEMEILLAGFTRVFDGDLDVREGNPLNAVDRRGATSLYLVGTLNDAFGDRDAKVQLLLHHGGRLFSAQFLLEWLSPEVHDTTSPSRLLLPVQIRRCLELWLTEDDSEPPRDEPLGMQVSQQQERDVILVDLCIKWLTAVASTGVLVAVLPIVVGAGYAREALPLLLGLPFHRAGLPELLGHVERFSAHFRAGALLLQLHAEISEAWEATLMST